MDMDQLQRKIDALRTMTDDPEEAHIAEDGLYLDFVRMIATEGPEPYATYARMLHTTTEIAFPRWYA